MRHLIAAVLFCVGLFCIAQAQVPMTGAGLGAPGGVCASYTGPGATAGGKVFFGVRAFNAADCGNKLMNVCDPTGAVCADFVSSTTTGDIVFQTVNGTACGTTDTCVVKTWYDRSGANQCSSAACDVTQSTNSLRPTLKHNCTTNGKACVVGVTGVILSSAASVTLAQTFTIASVSAISATGGTNVIIGAGASDYYFFVGGSEECGMFATSNGGTFPTCNATNTFISRMDVFNTAAPNLVINNSSNTGMSLGSGGLTGTLTMMTDGSNPCNVCSVSEAGAWAGTVNFYSNQSSYYGGF